VEAHDVIHRAGEKAERIFVAQIGFHHEGQPRDILQRPDVLGPDAALVHARARQRDVVIHAPHQTLQAVELQSLHLLQGM
jgi:hypothetical protein